MGALVGDVVAVKCAISQDDFEGGKNFSETVSQALCACIKLLGKDYLDVKTNAMKSSDGCFIYDMITIKYLRALATIEIGTRWMWKTSLRSSEPGGVSPYPVTGGIPDILKPK